MFGASSMLSSVMILKLQVQWLRNEFDVSRRVENAKLQRYQGWISNKPVLGLFDRVALHQSSSRRGTLI